MKTRYAGLAALLIVAACGTTEVDEPEETFSPLSSVLAVEVVGSVAWHGGQPLISESGEVYEHVRDGKKLSWAGEWDDRLQAPVDYDGRRWVRTGETTERGVQIQELMDEHGKHIEYRAVREMSVSRGDVIGIVHGDKLYTLKVMR